MDKRHRQNGLADAASALLTESSSDRFGLVSPSIYESARLVSLAPWLAGHLGRIRFLLDRQRPAGHWGGTGGYAVVPTLSATEALLTALRRDRHTTPEILAAADRGLGVLFAWFGGGEAPVPDTVAVELIVPALVTDINAHLNELAVAPVAGLVASGTARRLILPPSLGSAPLERVRRLAREGAQLPEKLWHSLEIAGPAIRGAGYVRPAHGAVGCSPAATAAWLGDSTPPGSAHESVAYLIDVQHHRGAVPVGAPIDVFERAWLLAQFAAAGLPVTLPRALTDRLHAAFTPAGASVGAGMLPDVDDTATALYALARAGSPHSPDSLWTYRTGRHFACFPDERTASTTANAHVLQALDAATDDVTASYTLARWLRDQQHEDGSWTDKWHASPFYATACCVEALARSDQDAVTKAASWVLENQRADGSWGRWQGTYEETAYAVQILLRAEVDDHSGQSVVRGCRFLKSWGAADHPPLWHDKDLYTPTRVVRAAGLAALHLARTHRRIIAVAECR